MKLRIILTVLVISAASLLSFTYNAYQPTFDANLAVNQVEDSNNAAATAKMITERKHRLVTTGIPVLLIAIIWIPFFIKQIKQDWNDYENPYYYD